jgi:hypothetical protein
MISRFLPLALTVPASLVFTAVAQNPPAQATRGEALFFETAKPRACGTCHSLGAKGTAVGPDLARWSHIAPRAVAMAVNATVTENVIVAKVGKEPDFPAVKGKDEGDKITLFDLSKNPPAPTTLGKSEYTAKPNATWKHAPPKSDMSAQELADIIAYIRWIGFKDTKGVKPEDVE